MKELTKGDNFLVSKNYERNLDIKTKKLNGVYYTPKIIVEYINKKTIENHDIIKNPYPKILDISCGCGNFLLEVYDILYNLIKNNIDKLKEIYGKMFNYNNIHNHILTNCIYGCDIDINAVNILKNSLKNKNSNKRINKINILCVDSLKYEFNEKFDYIIGNPPYIGHKKLEKKYKQFLLENYKETYKDKSDLYYCFYQKIIQNLKKYGLASIITPRYFLESPSGDNLRKYIAKSVSIKELVDFDGASIFKKIGVCSCILTMKKDNKENNKINIYKLKDENIDFDEVTNLNDFIKSKKFENFTINQNSINKEWIILNANERKFYDKLQSKCLYKLEDIATSFQGIITGCDKAFILKKDDEKVNFVDKKILKSWIKNKNIKKYKIENSDYKLIYSNDIDDINKYEYELKCIISPYKDKLSNRRECLKNIRKWYELQWARDKSLFEQIKIIYPYKCKENRFAIDSNNSFFSADVYSFIIKEEYKSEFSYEYIIGLLNSDVYDKYFKINAKKVSKNLYDYYPNKVMKIKIFKDTNYNEIESLSKSIIHCANNDEKSQIENLQTKINELIKQSLQIKSLI